VAGADVDPRCSIQAAVRRSAELFGDRPAVGLPGRLQSFAQTYDRTQRLVAALEGLGAQPGSRIAILASNGPWYFELHFAAAEGGLVEVPVNGRFTLSEQRKYLTRIDPEILLVTSEYVMRAEELQTLVPSIRHVIGIGAGHGLTLDYDTLLERADPSEPPLRDVDELLVISATSGTSGQSKAVQHTARTTATGYAPLIERFEIDEDAHFVTGMAMYFATAYSGWTASFIAGAKHTIMPAYSPSGWVDLVEQSRGTHGFLGPTPVYMIMDAGIDLGRLRGLRYLSMGGASCDPSRLRSITDALGQRVAIQLSMTELGVGTALLGHEYLNTDGTLHPRHRSSGRPIPGLEARTVDELGAPSAVGTEGELEFRGPVVSPGYLGDTVANDEAHHDDWFRTGDVARIDEDGYVFIVDRKKDLIVSGGINIAPSEIEQVLMAHPAVAAAGVCGVADSTYGEAVHAAVALRKGAEASTDELMSWCREHLASVKKPREIVVVDQLPMSSTGKLLRRQLRAQFDGSFSV
jgi:acyl-CoA synthetase (AMP-forming)/AMP-acid ligase II